MNRRRNVVRWDDIDPVMIALLAFFCTMLVRAALAAMRAGS